MLKRVDLGTRAFVADAVAGKKTAGVKTWGAKQGGVGYTTTGGYVKGLTVKIDAFQKLITSGAVVVPTDPKA
jgi:basic membrane protein A